MTTRQIAAQNFYVPPDPELEANHKSHLWRGEIGTRYVDGFEMTSWCANRCGAEINTRVQSAGESRMGNAAARQPCPGPKRKEHTGRG